MREKIIILVTLYWKNVLLRYKLSTWWSWKQKHRQRKLVENVHVIDKADAPLKSQGNCSLMPTCKCLLKRVRSPECISRSLQVLSSQKMVRLCAFTFSYYTIIFSFWNNSAWLSPDAFCGVLRLCHWNLFWKLVHYIFFQATMFSFIMCAKRRTHFYIK